MMYIKVYSLILLQLTHLTNGFLSPNHPSWFHLELRDDSIQHQPTIEPRGIRLYSSKGPDDVERMLDSASKLRKEVEELEAKLERKEIPASEKSTTPAPIKSVCTALPNSQWTLTYRFASEPPIKDDNKNADEKPRQYYSGRATLLFKPDGYTDLVQHEPTGGETLEIEKFWGWDEEVSSEDGLAYMNWAANIRLPKSDPHNPSEIMRFYLQARIDIDEKSKAISLSEGTVTVKKDIEPPGGFWGVFNGGGILAQFQYVGNFVAKPTQAS